MSEPNELSFEIKNSDEVPLDTYKSLALLDRYVKTCLLKQCDVDLTLKDGSTRKIVFNVIKKAGQGSYGIVSKIKKQGNKNELALKAVYLNSNHYYREIDILRQLTHPNIIDLIGYYKIKMKTKTDTGIQSNTCVCLITPYVRYTMLDALKNRVTYLPYIKKMYKQALSALEYMHSKNICHRDIKPTNILIDENYNLYICDLGSAKELKDNENNVSYICSRYYRAPECCLGNPNYDCKIDIWSLGIVFTDLETDYLLFVNKNNQDQLVEMQNFLILTKEDCKEMKLPVKPNGIGIEEYLKRKRTNTDLTEVLSNSIVMNPRKRATARMLLDMKYFRNETEMSI